MFIRFLKILMSILGVLLFGIWFFVLYTDFYDKKELLSQYTPLKEIPYHYATLEGIPTDYAHSIKWYKKAARKGYSNTFFELGKMYFYAEHLEQSNQLAFKWIKKSALLDNLKAQNWIAWNHITISWIIIFKIGTITGKIISENYQRRNVQLRFYSKISPANANFGSVIHIK